MSEIRWQPWEKAAFERAHAEDKPVLLSISAVWCHWCHVMDRTSYADPGVIAKINELYVPVRVDNDRRPDINARYNQGGWPTTAFLTPDGALMAGATYLPPQQMNAALDQIAAFYRDNRTAIAERAGQLREMRLKHKPEPAAAHASAIAGVLNAIETQFDEEYGGFGNEPKFPMTDVLELLLQEWLFTDDQRLYDMLARTLLAMSRGGTYDHAEGGFFRYSTTRDWSIPHFEKMAEDHGALLRILAQLVRHGGNPDFRATLVSACGYVRTVLLDAQSHLFAGSQDADEAYYALPLDERRKQTAPYVDRTSYSNWSAGLAASCICAGNALEDETLCRIGIDALDALAELRDDTGLLLHVREKDGTAHVRGLLTDQVAYLRALLDAHQETGERRFFDRAEHIAAAILDHFAAEDGGFYDHAAMEEPLGNLDLRDRPLPENCSFADSLLRLAALTGNGDRRAVAQQTLELFATTYAGSGMFAAPYARALRRLLEPPQTLVLTGSADETGDLREAALRLRAPLLSIATRNPRDGEERARAYYCVGTACAAAAPDASALRDAFESLAV